MNIAMGIVIGSSAIEKKLIKRYETNTTLELNFIERMS